MNVPENPKLFHIVHVDKLSSILADRFIWSDAESRARLAGGTVIGMGDIKDSRLQLALNCHSGLCVGECVPFYFAPRSVMLYVIFMANHPRLSYTGGQGPILHLQFDLKSVVQWADSVGLRWAFTLSGAATSYFESRKDLASLNEIQWSAVNAKQWTSCRDEKQAEFLSEKCVPIELVEGIGVMDRPVHNATVNALAAAGLSVPVKIIRQWYY